MTLSREEITENLNIVRSYSQKQRWELDRLRKLLGAKDVLIEAYRDGKIGAAHKAIDEIRMLEGEESYI